MSTAADIVDTFLAFIQENRLETELPEIVAELNRRVQKKAIIEVRSAITLTTEQKEKLRGLVHKKWGPHTVIFEEDPELLTGLYIHFQDQVIDWSGKTALSQFKQSLTN